MVINLLTKDLKRAMWFVLNRYRFKIWIGLFWMVLLAIGQQAKSQDFYLHANKASITDRIATDGYVQVDVPVYESDGYDEGVYNGWLLVRPTDGSQDWKKVFNFYTQEDIDDWQDSDDVNDKIWMILRYYDGAGGESYDKDGFSFVYDGSNYQKIEERKTVYLNQRYEGDVCVTRASFRWYIPSKFAGKSLEFKVRMDVDYNDDSEDEIRTESGVTTCSGGLFNTPQLSSMLSETPGKYKVTYSGVQAKAGDKIHWDKEGTSNSPGTTGSKEYDILNKSRKVTFTYHYKLHDYAYAERSATITLQPFRYPKTLTPTDTENGNTIVSWEITDTDQTSDLTDGYFEVQRATDNAFTQNIKPVGTVNFKEGQNHYSIEDKTGEENLNQTIYYRLRRSYASLWDWKYAATGSIDKKMSHINVISATAERYNWDAEQQAKITWQLESEANNKVWTTGAMVIVKRTMDYGSNNIKVDEIEATGEDMQNGFILDDLNVSCVNYTYSVYVRPGNSNYPAQKEVTAEIRGGEILPTSSGQVKSIVASKGYYSDYTSIEWETDGEPVDQFEILRREYQEGLSDDDNWVIIKTEEGGTQNSFVYNDELGLPGTIYEYRVNTVTICVDEKVVNPSKIVRGFRSSTGTINGQILFKYGDAVTGATVLATSNDVNLKKGQSLLFNGQGNMKTEKEMTVPTDASIQLFVKPKEENQNVTLLSWGHFSLGIQKGKPAISANGGTSWLTAETALPTDKFTQLTAVFDTDQTLWLYVDGEQQKMVTASGNVGSSTNKAYVTIGQGFKGYLDEVRLWSRILATKSATNVNEIEDTYNRLLTGAENGLVAYWRFNDPVTDEAYDISHIGTNYNKNHLKLSEGGITLADEYPTDKQLALRAVTDTGGNYQITGVPYIGESTTYTVTPSHPILRFNPTSRDVVIGNQQPVVADVSFTDNSAIIIQGYVFYENSSIPVKDATFSIDGTIVTANGTPIKTAADGKFTFSVPAGTHTVKVEKTNHTFKNGGRLLDSNGNNINFQEPLADVRFWDQTKVKLIGRVAGGTIEQNKPLGFSLSKNNLGDTPMLKLKLEGDATSEIYDQDVAGEDAATSKDTTLTHYDGKHKNKVTFNQYDIVINPDNETGEFEAWLFPVSYKLDQATVTGWEIMPTSAPTIDLTNVFVERTSEYTPVDKDGNVGVTQTLTYNEKFSLIHRVQPTISYKQGNKYGKTTEYFGLEFTVIPNLFGTTEKDTLWLYDREAKEYTFKGNVDGKQQGLPIFSVGTWGFHVEATEDYPYNGVKSGEDAIVDRVPTQGGDLSITNTFNQNAEPQKYELDNQGKGYIELQMDNPLFANNNISRLTFAVTIDGQVYTAPQLAGVLLGADPKGDGLDFVTAGPIRLLNILRDPPGSASYSWWESGHSYSYMASTDRGMINVGSETITQMLGLKKGHSIGLGAATIEEFEIVNNISATVNHEVSSNNPDAYTITLTTNNRYQTSDDPLNVGSAADVFIGYSNNIYYGAINEVELLDEKTYNTKGGKEKEIYWETTKNGKKYYICKGSNLNVNVSGTTLFSYPKMHIENILIPNLETLRNNLLFTLDSISESELQAKANRDKRIYYLSTVSADDEQFGQKGKYELIVPADYNENEFYDPYKKGTVKNGTPDSVEMYNNAIKEWIRILKQNEDEKLLAFKEADYVDRNRSFHASSPVEYTESYETAHEEGYIYDFTVTAGAMSDFGFSWNKTGTQISVSEEGGQVGTDEQSSSTTETSTSGFVLADEGDFDYLSVDVLRAAPVDTTFKHKWDMVCDSLDNHIGNHIDHNREKMTQYGNFVFRTRGGATACPYEPAEYTQYQGGEQILLNEATLQIERPDLTVEKPVVTNVPSDQAAVFNLKLMNDSQVSGCTAIFTLAIVDAANQHGAKFSIDGVPLADGRGIEVPYGEVLNKVLEVRRGTEYDYENLALVLKSQCQSDPTDNQADIADTVYISAHFIPSSSDINIKSPTDKWTLNTNAPVDSASGKYYLPLTIDGFDVNFQGFHHIEVQYKASSEADTRWTNMCSFFTDTTYYEEASGTKEYINGPTITARFFGAEDQNYDIRAVTYTKVGNEFVTKESPVITGVKDTKRPVVFGNIEPADGVLDVEDEIRLTFNEPIAEGYMTEVKNFRVTGVRNGSNGDHSTALTFDGRSSYLETQVTRNLESKDVTVEMWINPSSVGQDMTLFSHGDVTNTLELTLTKNNTLKVRIGELEYTSKTLEVKVNEWRHVAMTYQASNQELSVYYGGQVVITGIQTVPYSGIGPMVFGRSIQGDNYFSGKMHEARIWTKVVEMTDLIANALRIYTGRESGLTAYYPMNEGKGDMVTDKAQGATAYIYGATWNTQDGKSISFNGKNAVMVVNTTRVPIKNTSDYTLEFWFKADAGQKEDATLVANGKGIGEENNGNTDKVFVGFIDNNLVFRNNGNEQKITGNFRDGTWHHFVLAVNRTAGNAQIFMDGVLNSYFDASKVGGFSASNLYAGACRWTETESLEKHTEMYLNGMIDELRLWNMALPASSISNNYNVSPEGEEMGLMMYLPFSKYITNSANIKELVYSGEDLVTDSTLVTLEGAVATSEVAPVCKKAPETSIPFSFVVNKDALVINLMDTPEAIEKTTVNFTVKDVSDLNGNLMESPVIWSAYIDRNQLKWSEKSVSKEKKLNTTMSFTVDVENRGGTVKNFIIEGLPAWLDATPESGSIDPKGQQSITFTVDEGTNVGRYDEVIYIKGDNNVAEGLPISLKVFEEQPDWTVNPGDFKYNMNIYGRIRINKLFSDDTEDMLAAFDAGGRCIGVANSQYLKDSDMWYVFLTIYSNVNRISSEQIEFRAWDASTGLVYTAYPSLEIAFESDKVYGSASSPIIFDAEERVIQNIDLIKGWNWISYNVSSELFSDPANILQKAQFEGDEQVKDETNGIFMIYDGTTQQWVNNDLNKTFKFDNKHMFLLQSSMAQKLSVSGLAIHDKKDLTLEIQPNWNYISYLSSVNLPIAEALAGFEAVEGDIIKSQDRFSMYSEKTGWLGSLTYLEPGKGYMLFSKNKTTLTYPNVQAGTMTYNGLHTRNTERPTLEPVSELSGQYATNMSVIATVADNLPVLAGDRLLAYVGGELRGEAEMMEHPLDGASLFFLNVGGNSNEGITFALERNGEIIAKTTPMLDYVSNKVEGDIEQPFIIDFVNDLEISVYPNPFENEVNIRLNANPDDKVSILLYTIAGQMIHQYQEITPDGYIYHHIQTSASLSKGVYVLVVVINGEQHVYKIVKK